MSRSAAERPRASFDTRSATLALPVAVPSGATARIGSVPRIDAFAAGLANLRQDPNIEHLDIDGLIDRVKTYLYRCEEALTGSEPPLMIALGGPSAGGKTTNARHLATCFQHAFEDALAATVMTMDGFYPDRAALKRELGIDRFLAQVDLDTPHAWDMDRFQIAVANLRQGQPVFIHDYDFVTSCPKPDPNPIPPSRIYLIEGNHVLSGDCHDGSALPLHGLFDLGVYVHTDAETMDSRWRQRTCTLRDAGISEAGLAAFSDRVISARAAYVEPTRQHAQLVLNSGATPESVQITVQRLADLLTSVLL